MATNAFRVTLADSTPIGLCFEPVVSLANHSCTPNATIIFDGRQLTLRTLDPIKKGDQVFVSYIDTTQTREERRHELKDRYFFTCHCEKCEQDDGPYQTFLKSQSISYPPLDLFISQEEIRNFAQARCSDASATKVPDILPKVQDLLTRSRNPSISSAQQFSLLQTALRTCEPLQRNQQLAQPPYPQVLHELYLHYLSDQSTYTEALRILLYLYLHSDVYTYPQPHHPVRVIRLYTIAKLLQNVPELGDVDFISANQLLLLCVRELSRKSHGEETSFGREVREALADVEAVQRTRGSVGSALNAWVLGVGEEAQRRDGKEYARKIFEGLRDLAGSALDGVRK